jgi:ribonuclease BN (tRNA processing enzyme)
MTMGDSMPLRTLPAGLLLGLVACAPPGAVHAPPPTAAEAVVACGARGAAVQVLGSAGPMGAGGRASTGYVVWVDGRARALVDMGGGTFQRAASLGVRVTDLRAVLLTHYHVDHTADLPALLKQASFGERAAPLPIVGPSGDGPFPSWRGARVVFTGDQRMDESRFVDMARGADLLVAHHAVPEGASQAMRALHAPPSRIGELAARTGAAALVLSHHMQRSLDQHEEGLRRIRARYDGPVILATDLDCFPVP